VAAKVRTQLFV